MKRIIIQLLLPFIGALSLSLSELRMQAMTPNKTLYLQLEGSKEGTISFVEADLQDMLGSKTLVNMIICCGIENVTEMRIKLPCVITNWKGTNLLLQQASIIATSPSEDERWDARSRLNNLINSCDKNTLNAFLENADFLEAEEIYEKVLATMATIIEEETTVPERQEIIAKLKQGAIDNMFRPQSNPNWRFPFALFGQEQKVVATKLEKGIKPIVPLNLANFRTYY